MLDTTRQILQQIIEYIDATSVGKPIETIDSISIEINKSFFVLSSTNEIQEFYNDILREFQDNQELQILLLSVIYQITMEEGSLVQIINILKEEKIDIFLSLMIRAQIEILSFKNTNTNISYELRRELHRSLLLRFEEILDFQLIYRPLELRNSNRIVIVTNQILGDLHAPTDITKEICYVLQKKMGMEVLLIVAPEEMNRNKLEQVWYEPIFLNYFKEYNGSFVVEKHGKKILGYQIIMGENNLMELRQLVKEVYEYNPMCIWYMGNLTLFADLFRKYTTVLAMAFSDNYTLSDSQIMVRMTNNYSSDIEKMLLYIKKEKQVSLYYDLKMPILGTSKEYKRVDYNLDENAFLITVIGNRLDTEITNDFIIFLKRVLELDSRINIVFIGDYKDYNAKFEDKFFAGKVKCLGFQDDLVGILNLMDLYLNPPRKGGGFSAKYALHCGVPVVTLGYGDVASYLEEEYTCENLNQMLEMIKKYLLNQDFYNEQSRNGKLRYKNNNDDELSFNTKQLLVKVKEIILES